MFDVYIVFQIDKHSLRIGYWSEHNHFNFKELHVLDYILYTYELEEPLSNEQNKTIVKHLYRRLNMKIDFDSSSKEEKFYIKHVQNQTEFIDFFRKIYLALDQQLGLEINTTSNFFKK